MSSPNKLTLNTNPLQKRSDKKTKDMGYSPFKMKGPSLYTSPNKQITRAKMKKAGKKALEYTFNPVKTATDIYDYVTSKGETVGKKVAKTVKSAARDYAPKVSRKKAEESPAKSLLGLGKDNKAVKARNKVTRQENKEARKEHREAKKGDRKQHKADKKQYREDKKQYKKDKGSSKGGVLGTKYLSKKEMRYFMDNKKDYHEDWGKVHGGKLLSEKTTKLKGAHTKKGKERRKTIRTDYERDYNEQHGKPVKPTKKLKRSRPEKKKLEKLDTSIKIKGRNRDATISGGTPGSLINVGRKENINKK